MLVDVVLCPPQVDPGAADPHAQKAQHQQLLPFARHHGTPRPQPRPAQGSSSKAASAQRPVASACGAITPSARRAMM
jgi:hypothetical protein